MTAAACTLFEKDYHQGVAALANSLYRNGYKGTLFAGLKGGLPPWAAAAVSDGECMNLSVAPDFAIKFVPCTTTRHLTWHKADFMLQLFGEFCPEQDAMFYLDPDIVIDTSWSNFEFWAARGLALCADKYWNVPATHPARQAWREYTSQLGFDQLNELDVYVNAGGFGVSKNDMHFLQNWKRIMDPIAPNDGRWNPDVLPKVGNTNEFNDGDQFSFNAALAVTDSSMNIASPDAMAFEPGNALMYHAVGKVKPWSRGIAVKAPNVARSAEKFLEYCNSPIQLYSERELSQRKADLRTAKITAPLSAAFRKLLQGD